MSVRAKRSRLISTATSVSEKPNLKRTSPNAQAAAHSLNAARNFTGPERLSRGMSPTCRVPKDFTRTIVANAEAASAACASRVNSSRPCLSAPLCSFSPLSPSAMRKGCSGRERRFRKGLALAAFVDAVRVQHFRQHRRYYRSLFSHVSFSWACRFFADSAISCCCLFAVADPRSRKQEN